MKQSFVNNKITETLAFFKACSFHLPDWSEWPAERWLEKTLETKAIRENALGWDLTDFGFGQFNQQGLTLFTLRNGLYAPEKRPYCEKIMHVRQDQLTPYHYHADKIEDIIVRGGKGMFCLRILPTDENRVPQYQQSTTLEIDGMERVINAGEKITLRTGQSITLPPFLYHQFWAEGGDCLIGEVSTINNDAVDNYFLEALGRFSEIEADASAKYVLCNAYPQI